jgi:hypothetical protein
MGRDPIGDPPRARRSVRIAPSWEEQRFARKRYKDLAHDLEALGFEVELEDPPTYSADALALSTSPYTSGIS